MFKRLWHNINHTLEFWKNLARTMFGKDTKLRKLWDQYGLPMLIIFVVWEIIEDILWPIAMSYLAYYVDPWFATLIPAGWLVCLHPFAVPIIWSWWCFIFKRDQKKEVTDTSEE